MKQRSAWLLLILLIYSSCTHTRIDDFPFIQIDGTAVDLKESPSIPSGEEGKLILEDNFYKTPRYTIDSELHTGEGSLGLFLNYSGEIKGEIQMFYDSGSSRFPLPDGNSLITEAIVPLSPGKHLQGFQITAWAHYPDFKIRGAGIRKYESAVNFEGEVPVIPLGFEVFSSVHRREITILPEVMDRYLSITYTNLNAGNMVDEFGNIEIIDRLSHVIWEITPLLGTHSAYIPVSNSMAPVTIRDRGIVKSVEINTNENRYIDLGALLDPSEELKEDFIYYRWTDFPNILIFDTADYSVQSHMFKRLAYFVEKRGFSGKLLREETLEGLHGWNAHDYRAEDLAEFFNRCIEEQLTINSHEEQLKETLINERIISRENSRYYPLEGGVLSVSRESTAYLRELFLAHEGYHGIFFASSDFETFAVTLYEGIDDREKEFWKLFLAWKGYDIENEYLVANEMQAYLLQQPLDRVVLYFKEYNIPRMQELFPDYSQLLLWMQNDNADHFYYTAVQLHEYIRKNTGYGAGNLFSVRPAQEK